MNKEFAKAGVKKSVAPASEMANKPSGMSNRARFRLTCTVLNVVVIAATVAIIKPQMCKAVYSSVINSIKKTIKNVSNKVKPCQYLE